MELECLDLREHGVVLVPASSPDYDSLLEDIQSRAANPPEGSPPPIPQQFRTRVVPEDRPASAILLNHSAKAIVALHVIWKFETETGRTSQHSRGMLSPRPLLLPFGMPDHSRRLIAYWSSIIPGSKRYIGESGMVGTNTDVRLPAEDEKWVGGIAGAGGGGSSWREPVRRVTLVLDGIFFDDGEFVGPDTSHMFQQTVADAQAHRLVAAVATEGHDRGLSPADILAEIEKTTGPAPEHHPMPPRLRNRDAIETDFLKAALQGIAWQLDRQRRFPQSPGDDFVVRNILTWNDVSLPSFRRS